MNLSWSVTRSTSRLQFHRVFLSLCFKCIPFFLIIFFNLSFIFNTEGTQEPRYIECKCVICDGGCAGGGQRDSYHLLGFLTNLPHRPLFKTISDGAAIGRQPIAFATLTGTMRNTGKKRESSSFFAAFPLFYFGGATSLKMMMFFFGSSGYFETTDFIKDARQQPEINFYDSNTGKLLFTAPKGRSMEDFLVESRAHGWPSFRGTEPVPHFIALPCSRTIHSMYGPPRNN